MAEYFSSIRAFSASNSGFTVKRGLNSFGADLSRTAAVLGVDARLLNCQKAQAWGRLFGMSGIPVRKIASY